MAKNRNKPANSTSAPVSKQPIPQKQETKTLSIAALGRKLSTGLPLHALLVTAIALITWLFFQVCLDNQLTNWDDPGYVKDNALIKDLSFEGIKNIFSTPIMGNYHPLTILTYAFDYSYDRLQPWFFHLDSLLLHILATILVYWFVNLLTRRPVAAAVTALLFGLHPMHVESIAWIAGRKDPLYGVFYIGACIAYLQYVRTTDTKKWLLYGGAILLFLASLLSKPVAVTLPLTLLLLDYYEARKFNYRILVEKIPHFAIAIGFGIKSVLDQKTFGSLGTQTVSYNFLERIGLGGYALVTYLWKAILPVDLKCFYPYPLKSNNGTIEYWYYLYPAAVIALVFLLWKFARKNRMLVFGCLFFLVNIILLLQFIPVGGAILADRYSYIPYLGLFFIAGWFVSVWFEPGGKKVIGYPILAATVAYSFFLGNLSNERCKVWYDTASLWRDEIEKEPIKAPNAYNNLGFNYFNKFNDALTPAEKKIYFDSAYYLLNRAIELQPTFVNPYISLGELTRTAGDFVTAKSYYNRALALKGSEEDANAYLGLAIIYAIGQKFDSSGYCFKMALQYKPYFPEAISNYGNFLDMTGRHDEALVQYGKAIAQNPDMYAPYLNRGRALTRMKRCDEAIKDFEKAMQISPNMGEVYYARSFCFAQKGNKGLAIQDIQKAISLGFNEVDTNYLRAMQSR